MRRLLPRIVSLLAVAVVLTGGLAACGDDDDATTAPGSTAPGSTAPSTTRSATTVPAGELPGEEVAVHPYEGAQLAVVGVDRADTLALRAGPGTSFDMIAELDPLATGIVATGHNRTVDDSFWSEVDVDGQIGWANVRFLLQLGATDDITDQLASGPGGLPRGGDMVALAEAVGARRASDEPPSRVAVIEEPEIGDLGSITVDVVGMGDDAIGGERLHILAEPTTDSGFVVQSVQRLTLCSRGVTAEGLCV